MSKRAVSASALLRRYGASVSSLILPLFGALACSGSDPNAAQSGAQPAVSAEISACIEGHPAAEPFDVGAVARDPEGASAPPSVETFAAQCRSSGGSGCDGAFISLEAARCIAQDARFQPGLEEWTLALTYDNSRRRVTWGIENVLMDNGPNDYSGESLTIDAVSGQVLGKTTWQVRR